VRDAAKGELSGFEEVQGELMRSLWKNGFAGGICDGVASKLA
jgi:hypothetical protein